VESQNQKVRHSRVGQLRGDLQRDEEGKFERAKITGGHTRENLIGGPGGREGRKTPSNTKQRKAGRRRRTENGGECSGTGRPWEPSRRAPDEEETPQLGATNQGSSKKKNLRMPGGRQMTTQSNDAHY